MLTIRTSLHVNDFKLIRVKTLTKDLQYIVKIGLGINMINVMYEHNTNVFIREILGESKYGLKFNGVFHL